MLLLASVGVAGPGGAGKAPLGVRDMPGGPKLLDLLKEGGYPWPCGPPGDMLPLACTLLCILNGFGEGKARGDVAPGR